MWKSVEMAPLQAGGREDFRHAGARLLPVGTPNQHRFTHALPDPSTRIERSEGILEDHLHPVAGFRRSPGQERSAVKQDLSLGG